MRYEVRLIGSTDHSDSRTRLYEPLCTTDSAAEAKLAAERHAHDGANGTAIVDFADRAVDIGTESRMPLSGFRLS